jgi:hypothetical protein
MWECEWCDIKATLDGKKQLEEDAKQQNINVRNALCGGRCEGFRNHVLCNEFQKLFYFDIVSLYPTVNALDAYPIGFGRYRNDVNTDDILNDRFFGFVKCKKVIPNKKLHIPVLPDRSDGKLMFHLEDMVDKEYTSVEVKLALQKGYQIEIASCLEFDK